MRALTVTLCLGLAACGGSEEPDVPAVTNDEASERVGVFGVAPAAAGSVPTVVMLRPTGTGTPIDPQATAAARDEPRIDQFGLAFSPTLLLISAGETIVFTNSEGALAHNVHVRRTADDVSLLNDDANSGDELRLTVNDPGGYDILCDMHPGMMAFVFATDAAYATFADPDGTFTLGAVPPGEYEVQVWTADGGYAQPAPLSVPEGRVDVDLRSPH